MDSFSDVWDRSTVGGPCVEFKIHGRHAVMKLEEARRFAAAIANAIAVAEDAEANRAERKGAA